MFESSQPCQLRNKDMLTATALAQIGHNGLYRSIVELQQCPNECSGPVKLDIPRTSILGAFVPFKTVEICPFAANEADNQ